MRAIKYAEFREKLFVVISLACCIAIPYLTWPSLTQDTTTQEAKSHAPTAAEQIFILQTRYYVGLFAYGEDRPQTFGMVSKSEMLSHLEDAALQGGKQGDELGLGNPLTSTLMRMQYITARYFGLDELAASLQQQLKNHWPKQTERELDFNRVIWTAYDYVSKDQRLSSYLVEELNSPELARELGWFHQLLLYDLQKRLSSDSPSLSAGSIRSESIAFFKMATVALATIIFIFVGCSLSCLVLGFLAFTGRLRRKFLLPKSSAVVLLEVFTLYLLAMSLGMRAVSYLIDVRGDIVSKLAINVLLIFSLPLLLIWPLIFGQSWSTVRRDIGLHFGGVGRALKDILSGIIGYLSAWPLLLAALIFTALIVSLLGLDIERGTHPIVPVLMEAKSSWVLFLSFVLAVIAAPVVEEIMFRGVLYSWLRTKMGALGAIFSSAVIFAVVHPQGVVGIIPLVAIGMALAALREWRNSLLCPMVAHACFNGGTLILVTQALR